jgi:hypothetical protein
MVWHYRMPLNARQTTLLVALTSFAIGAIVTRQLASGRRHQDLDFWVHEHRREGLNSTPDRLRARQKAFLLDHRDEAIPYLLRDLHRQDSAIELFHRWMLSRGWGRFAGWFQPIKSSSEYRNEAAVSLRLLGAHGRPAIPALWQCYSNATRLGWGPYHLEMMSMATTLAVLDGTNQETVSVLSQMTNSSRAMERIPGWVIAASFGPTHGWAVDSLRKELMPDQESALPALTASQWIGDIGPPAAHLTPLVRSAIARTYLSWPLTGLAVAAHRLWLADGDPQLALQVVRRAWTEFTQQLDGHIPPKDAGPNTEYTRASLYELAWRLGSIPEVARELRPLIDSLPASDPDREAALRCLEAIPQ